MAQPTPLSIGLDVHNESIAVAHAQGQSADPPVYVSAIGTRQQALQALRGVQWLVAITVVAELGDLTRFDSPRQLGAFVDLIPSEYSTGATRRQGGITKAGNGRARRALIEGAWAYRHPATVSQHIQTRIDGLPKPIQDL